MAVQAPGVIGFEPPSNKLQLNGPALENDHDQLVDSDLDEEEEAGAGVTVEGLKALEEGNDIRFRTCSWQKTAALLFSEYICLAIMSFPWSYSVLGLVPGIILTLVVAASVLYTSLVLWKYCLRHPEVKDVCDIGQKLFWNKEWAWYFTAVCFLLNNTFIQALHCLVGAKYLNTMTNHSLCTVSFTGIIALWSCLFSLPRTFSSLSHIATISAATMFLSVILTIAFASSEPHPAGYSPSTGSPLVTAFPVAGTSFVTAMSAFLNISYTFIGQITIPSFIAEMKEPRDFPKALWAVTIAEVVVFTVAGAVVYRFTGNQYMTTPAYGTLGNVVFKKIAFSFALPTIIFVGVLYASVSARFLFFRIFEKSRHKYSHTPTAWLTWSGLLALTWLLAWLIAELIPFFTDLLSIMSSLFDSFFGFIFWGVAFFRMRRQDQHNVVDTAQRRRRRKIDREGSDSNSEGEEKELRGWGSRCGDWILVGINVGLVGVGVYFLTVGTFAAVKSIVDNFENGAYGGVFSCLDNSL